MRFPKLKLMQLGKQSWQPFCSTPLSAHRHWLMASVAGPIVAVQFELQPPQPSVAPSSHASAPHLMPSPQTADEQTLALQKAQSQSVPMLQILPGPHFGHALDPPQSMSVSVWFFNPSEQVCGWHFNGKPLQRALLQSPSVLHVWPVPQSGQDPPQSMSDSVWFLTVSTQVGAWQTLPRHTLLWQSVGTAHVLGGRQRGHPGTGMGPPQSVSLSP